MIWKKGGIFLEITAAKLRYLLTISELTQAQKGKVRCIDVAVQLGVARPSACRMLAVFAKEGLLSRSNAQGLRLTEAGCGLVSRYEADYQALCRYFEERLKLPAFDARECAMALLASAPESSRRALCAKIST